MKNHRLNNVNYKQKYKHIYKYKKQWWVCGKNTLQDHNVIQNCLKQ